MEKKKYTVSHHYLRRMARRRQQQLVRLQKAAGTGRAETERVAAQKALRNLKVTFRDHLAVERTERGPYRWRVVAS